MQSNISHVRFLCLSACSQWSIRVSKEYLKIKKIYRVIEKKLLPIFNSLASSIKRRHNISNTRDSVSSGYPDTEKRVDAAATSCSGVFLTKFEVFG